MSARTPAALGYRMPAEWEPHEATWLAWPHEPADWPGKIAPIPWVYGEVVRHLSRGEIVRILVPDAAVEKKARALLARVGVDPARVELVRIATDRSWTRDTCPLFVKNGKGRVAMTNWRFNGWAKYPNHKKDDAINDRLVTRLKMTQWTPTVKIGGKPWRVVLEGGSVDVDGQGTILTTEECLLSPIQARNPGMSREEIERVLCEHLGARKVLWLGNGIAGDDTHGHVDDLARFVDARTVVIASEDDPADANFGVLRDNYERLRRMTNADGERLRVEKLPMPAPVVLDGVRLPASYANFYVGNAAVLVPTFNDPRDREALAILARLFPTRAVVGIHAVDLVWGLGTLHCMTQQQPAGVP
ncbi:MAG TPA: agmatine deiminase family protein [Polyangia bacterium]|jgi:agmatine deiminase|nr:agmatine deiminase family protein [Polyangia bacterium]